MTDMKCCRKGSSDANVEFGGCYYGGERVLVSMVSDTGCVCVAILGGICCGCRWW